MTRWIRIAAAFLALCASGFASAEGFSLSPLRVTIPARETSSAVVAENTGESPIVIQVKPLAWSQRDGKDLREDTRELIVNPPIFKLAPGEQQLVRIASRMPPPRDAERSYRVVFTEVPPREALQGQTGFRVALAMDIPVIQEPVAPASPRPVVWTAERTDHGLRIKADNPGNVQYRIVDVQFAAGDSVLRKQGFVVVLPMSWLSIDLPAPPADASVVRLAAQGSDGQQVAVDIALPPR